MNALQMYFLVKLTTIVVAAWVIAVISGFFLVASLVYMADTGDRDPELTDVVKWLMVTFLTAFAMVILVPTTKQMAAIIVVPKIVNSERVQNVGNKIYDLAVEWMDELHPKKKGELHPRKKEAGR